ncbi:MAG: hypothetical protein E6J37_06660 [Chloroflexi bacterium]|nr:MAG: hypothetical protein E6J37_06660 [Chloroflexota bacterium]
MTMESDPSTMRVREQSHARRSTVFAEIGNENSSSAVRLPVIASGGAGTSGHLYDALTEGGAEAALAATIFHFGELSIKAVKQELAGRGLEIRR